jgi:hypothetical protein
LIYPNRKKNKIADEGGGVLRGIAAKGEPRWGRIFLRSRRGELARRGGLSRETNRGEDENY